MIIKCQPDEARVARRWCAKGVPEAKRRVTAAGALWARKEQMIETIEQVVGKPAMIDRQSEQPGDVRQTWADVSKAGELWGYKPTTSFKDGVTAFYEWWR